VNEVENYRKEKSQGTQKINMGSETFEKHTKKGFGTGGLIKSGKTKKPGLSSQKKGQRSTRTGPQKGFLGIIKAQAERTAPNGAKNAIK